MPQKIAVLFDFSAYSYWALNMALQIASQNSKTRVLVWHFFDTLAQNAKNKKLIRGFEVFAGQELSKKISESMKESGLDPDLIDCRLEIIEGKIVPAALSKIKKEKPDLVLMGTHGRAGLKKLLLGSVAEKLVRFSPSPVMIVRKRTPWPPRKIVIPTDLSASTEEALLITREVLAGDRESQVDLLHVLSLPDMVALEQAFNPDDFAHLNLDEINVSVKSELVRIIKKHKSLNLTPIIASGLVVDEVSAHSDRVKADLIVLSTHGRSGLGHFLMGSTAESVVRHTNTNVLVFCPKKFVRERNKAISK